MNMDRPKTMSRGHAMRMLNDKGEVVGSAFIDETTKSVYLPGVYLSEDEAIELMAWVAEKLK